MSTDTQDRKPAPDQAENNAFFPSPYSLSQYTAPKTGFSGLGTDRTYDGDRWKVLVLGTQERYMLMQNETFFSTGNHPVETLLPMHHIHQAGYALDIATVTGDPVKFEWWAFPQEDEAVKATWAATEESFKNPLTLSEVIADGLDDYAAIFIPGGHGAMNGLPFSPVVRETLDWFEANNRLVITLCHGPAALLAAGHERDTNPFSGYELVAFPDVLDFGANLDIGYLPGKMPWKLGERLQADGIRIKNDDMTGATMRDRNLLTGDSPLAADQLGKDSVAALLAEYGE